MTKTTKVTTESNASAYLDNIIEAMKKHGVEPAVPQETYRQAVNRVSRAFSGLRRVTSS